MKVGKITDGVIDLVDVEDGMELGGERSEEQLYLDGYKKACPLPEGTGEWREYPTCFVQESAVYADPDQEKINE